MVTLRYRKRHHQLPAGWFERHCEQCASTIEGDEEVVCTTCGHHEDCVDIDDGVVLEMSDIAMRECARDLKAAMIEARRANLNIAASRIEGALRSIYPEWPGLVAP